MAKSPIQDYIKSVGPDEADAGAIGYIAALEKVSQVAPETAASIVRELRDQRNNLKLIASENYSSLASQLAMGNLLTDKYAEGYPNHRFYAGCDNVDAIETYAVEQAKKLFDAEYAYVQPHSGADANLIAYWAVLTTRVQTPMLENLGETNPAKLDREQWDKIRAATGNQKLMGLDYYSGGHLTHGYRFNVSAQMFDAYSYGVNADTGVLDYDAVEKMAMEIKPFILVTGYSAYPRLINFRRMKEIADKVGAVFMVDMAHFAGLVAGKAMTGDYNPIPHADIVTTTTHKTLRGPRGGLILAKEEFADAVNKGCPLVIGGPLPHVTAAKAVAFTEANSSEFETYAKRIVENSHALAEACIKEEMTLSSGGSDNHLMLLNVTGFGINGRQAESVLRECGITLNRNALPEDPNGPWYTSGLRIGTPAVTTLGMGPEEMREIASIIKFVLSNTKAKILTKGKNAGNPSKSKYDIDQRVIDEAVKRVGTLLDRYPVYPELDLDFLMKHFVQD
ncbi:MAG: glycine hydroxymethyltransferase [Spirochaetaceae bacterium]|nr:glycine hydroxymethyltransferase [Spirochaetaceae bacterium]MCF7948252.1 glycine hydroxymethyltransferase [Spirochaetia bacterium]MCF7950945.1 glycine hydroxymethyltransferase [Spirochaetaceae bacterium]